MINKYQIRDLSKLFLLGIVSFFPVACEEEKHPSRFRTIDTHFANAQYLLGSGKAGNDLDFDLDEMDDYYFITDKGELYHTLSRRLLTGEDTLRERTWVKNDIEVLKNRKKGKYDSH